MVTRVANPPAVLRNQSTTITVNATTATGTIDSNTGVSLDLTPLGGTSIYLVRSNTSTLFTNTIVIPPTAPAAGLLLTATAVSSVPLNGSGSVALTVNSSTEVWNGAGGNQNWSPDPNWVSGVAPGYAGDSVTFAGTQGTANNMDNNYTIAGLVFDPTAGSFKIWINRRQYFDIGRCAGE